MTALSLQTAAHPLAGKILSGSTWQPARLTVARYHSMFEAGILTEEDKVELIDGLLIDKMPVGDRHITCVNKLTTFFVLRFQMQYEYSPQNPIVMSDLSEPEPDFVVLNLEKRAAHPGKPIADDAELVIEVADSTLENDRGYKARMYAFSGIREYWIINLQDNQVEVYTRPNTATGTYGSIIISTVEESIDSLLCGSVAVADLIP